MNAVMTHNLPSQPLPAALVDSAFQSLPHRRQAIGNYRPAQTELARFIPARPNHHNRYLRHGMRSMRREDGAEPRASTVQLQGDTAMSDLPPLEFKLGTS